MFKFLLSFLLISFFISPGYGYQSSFKNRQESEGSGEKDVVYKGKEGEFFISATMTGAGIGFKLRKSIINDVTLLTLDFQIGGARGEKEAVYYYPYYGYVKTGRNFFTFFIPFYIGLQRRLFKEDIESNFRPFIIGEIGPVFGVSFPTTHSFGTNLKKGRGQPTVGGFFGIGIEFGPEEEGNSAYSFSAGYRILAFLDKLGEKKDYSSFALRLGWVVRW